MGVAVAWIAIVFFLFPLTVGFVWDMLSYNKGVCRECGKTWKMFDVDSQGGRMYKCENGHWCVVSYPLVDR